MTPSNESPRGNERPHNLTRVYWSVGMVCLVLLLIEPVLDKHGEVAIEDWFGFHGLFGFVAGVGLVLAAKALRRILMRPENYYDR